MGACDSRDTNKHNNVEEDVTPRIGELKYNFSNVKLPVEQPKSITSGTGLVSDYVLPVYGAKQNLYRYKSEKQNAEKRNDTFYDKDFAALDSSIAWRKNQLRKKIDACEWKRPWEFMDDTQQQIYLFEGLIEPNDIKQGYLGNCYFLSALSVISERYPELIRRLFLTPNFSGLGLYGMFVNLQGHWTEVCVDDRIPCYSDGGPIFSRCHGNELWVVLLEKAYAKTFGCYANIESGLPGQALRDLTGAPCDYLLGEPLEEEETWVFMCEGLKRNYMLTASSEGQGEQVKDSGIVSEHCYAILQCEKVKDGEDVEDRIVKMRNPWGHKEWSGDWGDGSSRWNEELKERLKVEDKDDGIFWISIKDFIKQFNQVCLCRIHSEYVYGSYELKEGQKNEEVSKRLMLMRADQQCHGFITVSQKDRRYFPGDTLKYALARVVVCRIEENRVVEFVSEKVECERDVYVECNLKVGTYLIYVELEWNGQWSRSIVLSAYSEQPLTLLEIDAQPSLTSQVLDNILFIHQGFDNDQSKDYGNGVTRKSGLVAGYLYFAYHNQSIGHHLQETIEMKNISNLDIMAPYNNKEKFTVTLGPQSHELVKYRVLKQGNGAFSYATRIQFNLSQQYDHSQLILMAKTSYTKQVQRKIQGNNIDVYFNIFDYQGGTAFLYVNQTNKQFHEDLKLTLKNMIVEFPAEQIDGGISINYILYYILYKIYYILITEPVKVLVMPNQEFLISLKTIDNKQPVSYSMSMNFMLK